MVVPAGGGVRVRTIAQVLDFVPRGNRSMEAFLLALADQLGRAGWRTVHVFAKEPTGAFREQLDALGSPIDPVSFPLTWRQGLALGARLHSLQPRIVQTHFVSAFASGLPTLKRRAGARALIVTDHASGTSRPKAGVLRSLARARGVTAGTWIDRVVAVSEFVRQRNVRDGFIAAGKTCTIYNGVDVERYAPATVARDGGPPVIGFVGQLIPEKGVATLLRAILKLEAEGGGPVRVRIAGIGPQEGELRDLAARCRTSDISFLGHIDWVPAFLGSLDIAVVPSEWEEACAFSVLEALACGTCLIVSDAGGNPELAGDGGAALVFPKGNVEALAQLLHELASDPDRRQRMRQDARQRALAHFSIERMVEDHAALIQRLDEEA
jgi:glycosyltransferase involved in cell wall biosynthesis